MKKKEITPYTLEHITFRVPIWMRNRLDKIAKANKCTLSNVLITIIASAFITSDVDFVNRGGKI